MNKLKNEKDVAVNELQRHVEEENVKNNQFQVQIQQLNAEKESLAQENIELKSSTSNQFEIVDDDPTNLHDLGLQNDEKSSKKVKKRKLEDSLDLANYHHPVEQHTSTPAIQSFQDPNEITKIFEKKPLTTEVEIMNFINSELWEKPKEEIKNRHLEEELKNAKDGIAKMEVENLRILQHKFTKKANIGFNNASLLDNAPNGDVTNFPSNSMMRKTKKRFPCKLCDKSYSGNFNLKSHIDIVHKGLREFKCDLCVEEEKTFGRRETLKTHLALVHGKVEINEESRIKAEKKYSCQICEKSYTQPHNLKSHMESCHTLVEEIDDQKIENMDKFSEAKAELEMGYVNSSSSIEMKAENQAENQDDESSMKNVHEGAKSSNSFDDRIEIKLEPSNENTNESPNNSEMISHKNLNDFVPNLNGSSTTNINYMINSNNFQQNEIKPPSNAKKFACKQCDKSFTLNFNLKNHIKIIHENLREFGCNQPDCNSNFGRRQTLMTHLMLVHGIVATKDKNETKHARKYRCKHCEKGYTTSTNLKLHMKNVHEGGKNTSLILNDEEEQFTCENCKYESNASFNTKELLELHILQYHSDDE